MFKAAKNKKEAKDIAFERERLLKQTIEELHKENLKLMAEADKYYSLYISQHDAFERKRPQFKQTIEDLIGAGMMDEINELVIECLLEKLIGPIKPIGETNYDNKALENLEKWDGVMNIMVDKMYNVATMQCNGEASIMRAKQTATNKLKELFEIYDENWEKWKEWK